MGQATALAHLDNSLVVARKESATPSSHASFPWHACIFFTQSSTLHLPSSQILPHCFCKAVLSASLADAASSAPESSDFDPPPAPNNCSCFWEASAAADNVWLPPVIAFSASCSSFSSCASLSSSSGTGVVDTGGPPVAFPLRPLRAGRADFPFTGSASLSASSCTPASFICSATV